MTETQTDWVQRAGRAKLKAKAQAVMDVVHGQDAEPYPLIVAAALREAINQCQDWQGFISAADLHMLADYLDKTTSGKGLITLTKQQTIMNNETFPITPPPELIEDWIELAKPLPQRPPNLGELATLAARWGADQELEACCEWFRVKGYHPEVYRDLRAARRLKPPSLKEQGLKALDSFEGFTGSLEEVDIIRRALEQLDG